MNSIEENVRRVPKLIEEWRSKGSVKTILEARGALLDACEHLTETAGRESRALTADEGRAFDTHIGQLREVNAAYSEYRRQRVADVVAAGFPAEHCRLPL